MLKRAGLAVLHRSGIVAHLRALWRSDIRDTGRRAADKNATQLQGLRQALLSLREAHGTQAKTIGETRRSLAELAAEVAALGEKHARLERRAHALEEVLARNRRDGSRVQAFREAARTHRIARHAASVIAAAPITDDPAPLLVIERLFPDDIYDIFLAAIPPAAAFKVRDRTKADYRARSARTPVPELTELAWSYLDDELIPNTIVPAIAARFAPYIDGYYRHLFGESAGGEVARLPLEATDARLMLRRPGYHLEPHMDPKRVLLTGLMYFARPGDNEAYGTTFYRVGPIAREHATTYYPHAFGHTPALVRSVPFRPNTAVVFLNSAAHAADLPADAAQEERYALQFYVGPPVQALKQVIAGLPEAQQRSWRELLDS